MKQVLIAVFVFVCPAPLWAQDVVFLGETHDNPGHHARQTERVTELQPKALVFEMLTPAQAGRITPSLVADATALETALDWTAGGWPEFAMYYPIFAAAPDAQMFGAAVPREDARRIMSEPAETVFGTGAEVFGLNEPLPEAQQKAREALQHAAHCDALPTEMLPMMVEMQRLRDAALARAAKQAFDATGGPVVVITGNGHARRDWGAPALLAKAAPEVEIYALAQAEQGASEPEGLFDEVAFSPAATRDDPCAAFR